MRSATTTPILLAALALAPTAKAQALEVGPPVPGRAGHDNVVTVTGATPGANVRLVVGRSPGPTPVPGCPGVSVAMQNPLVVGPVVADGAGVAVFSAHIPAALQGQARGIQAVQRSTCDISAPVGWVFPSGTELSLSGADARMRGEAGSAAGNGVAFVGDVNGDGFGDVVIGAPLSDAGGYDAGAAHLVLGPVTGEVDLAASDARFVGEGPGDLAGHIVPAAGDVNGDGFDDMLVGAAHNDAAGYEAGAAYLVLGPVLGDVDLGAADARIRGENPGDHVAVGLAGVGDVNGDGFDDIVLGASTHAGMGVDAGAAYVVHGPISGDVDLAFPAARLLGEAAGHFAGCKVNGAGDVDGDGAADILIGAYGNEDGGVDAGVAYLMYGPVTGDVDLAAADARLLGEPGDWAGRELSGAGDVDGDGLGDLLIGAWGHDGGGPDAGAVYVVHGPVNGDFDLGLAAARLEGEAAGDWVAWGIGDWSAGDLDGDGFDDMLVAGYGSDAAGLDSGTAYVVYGPVGGQVDLAAADVRLVGEAAGDGAGLGLSGGGDVDADGVPDLLIGAFSNDVGGLDAGAGYLVLGASL